MSLFRTKNEQLRRKRKTRRNAEAKYL